MRSLHSMGLLLAVMVVMIALPKGTQGHASMRVAHRVLYSSVIEANSTDSSTTSSGDDSCSQPELVEGCLVDVSCQTCLLRAGCAIETSTGKCVSASRLSGTTVGGVEYLLSGHTHYCDANDQGCGSCQDGGNETVCRGADSCVCVHQCEVRPKETGKCESGRMTNITLLLPAVALVAALCVNLYMRRTRQRQENTSSSRSSGQGRRPQAQEDATNSPTLKLDGWRQCVQTQSENLSNVELKGCAIVAQSKPSKPNAEAHPTDQLAHESSDDTYIQVNTPTASSARAP